MCLHFECVLVRVWGFSVVCACMGYIFVQSFNYLMSVMVFFSVCTYCSRVRFGCLAARAKGSMGLARLVLFCSFFAIKTSIFPLSACVWHSLAVFSYYIRMAQKHTVLSRKSKSPRWVAFWQLQGIFAKYWHTKKKNVMMAEYAIISCVKTFIFWVCLN